MELEDLQKSQTEIEEKIKKFAEDNNLSKKRPKLQPITDGIVNIQQYFNSKYRIMWVLKEAYDDTTRQNKNNKTGGGWSLADDINKKTYDYGVYVKTLKRIAYVTYGILNGIEKYNKIPDIEESYVSLKSIAIANTGKMPALTNTSEKQLKDIYNTWHEILIEQIKAYEPNIIIFGNTFNLFQDELTKISPLKSLGKDIQKNKDIFWSETFKWKDAVIISAFHPACHYKESDYVNSILRAFKNIKNEMTV